jgi:hypothetical protein
MANLQRVSKFTEIVIIPGRFQSLSLFPEFSVSEDVTKVITKSVISEMSSQEMQKFVFEIKVSCIPNTNRGRAVGIAAGYRLDDRGVAVRVPVVSRMFTFPYVQTGYGVHPGCYPVGTRGSLLEG